MYVAKSGCTAAWNTRTWLFGKHGEFT